MERKTYVALREHLGQLPMGFPQTASGIELTILEMLFAPAEASMALALQPRPESAETVASRVGRPVEEVEGTLAEMARKGLVFRRQRDGEARFALVPFVPGIYEFQVKRLDPAFARAFEQYLQEGLAAELGGSPTPPFRVIPLDAQVSCVVDVMPYEQASRIINEARLVALTECICRKEQELLGKGCGKPKDVCLLFGGMAEFYIEQGLGQAITREEAIEVLDRAEGAGLVHCPTNTAGEVRAICNCCKDCCGILRGVTEFHLPHAIARSNFVAEVDSSACVGDGVCCERCQVNAVAMSDEAAVEVLQDRCIGCGLCVSSCPTSAMRLVRRPCAEGLLPPASFSELMGKIAWEKGRSQREERQCK